MLHGNFDKRTHYIDKKTHYYLQMIAFKFKSKQTKQSAFFAHDKQYVLLLYIRHFHYCDEIAVFLLYFDFC